MGYNAFMPGTPRHDFGLARIFMRRVSVVALTVAIAVGLEACSTPPPTVPTPGVSPLTSPLASPVVPRAVPTPALPTPVSKDKAVVGGVILREIQGQPVQGLTSGRLFLGTVHMENGRPLMAGLDKNKAPQTLAMDNGQFMFKEVPASVYVLIFDSPGGAVVLKNPKTGADMLIEVKGGEVINLGELRYPLPY